MAFQPPIEQLHKDLAKKLISDWKGEMDEKISQRSEDILSYYLETLLARVEAKDPDRED